MNIKSALIVGGLIVFSVGLYRFGVSQGVSKTVDSAKIAQIEQAAAPAPNKKPLYWHDPMVPTQRFDQPGKSPFMDMDLVPVYADDHHDGGNNGNDKVGNNVNIDSRVQQNLGIRTAVVMNGTLASNLTVVGNIAYNERDLVLVQARSNAFVEHVYSRAPLDPVKKGQKLADIYVPDWIAAQEEYLTVRAMQGNHLDDVLGGMLDGARQRMQLVGMSEEQINHVTTSGKVQARMAITAPISGVITELTVREGMTLAAGTALFKINGLSTVWVNAEVPENLAAQVGPGGLVEVRVAALTGTIFKGRVTAVLPDINPTTRTLTARIELANPKGELVPGMFASINFLPKQSNPPVLLVPSEAVIQTGLRSVVMVEQGPGKFSPVEIETGRQAQGQTEVRKGLTAGQKIVVSGQFLIDSEASLKGTTLRMTDTATEVKSQGAIK